MVVRRETTVESWTVPLEMRGHSFNTISRIMCPFSVQQHQQVLATAQFYIDVSTSSVEPVTIYFVAYKVENFKLRRSEPFFMQVTPSSPVFFQYNFTSDDQDEVIVKVTSDDDLCAVVSVQEVLCPVRVLPSNYNYRAHYQSMMTKSALTIKKQGLYDQGAFFVVVIVLPVDTECSSNNIDPASAARPPRLTNRKRQGVTDFTDYSRQKNISIVIEKGLTGSGYGLAMAISITVCVAFYILGFLIIWLRWWFEQRPNSIGPKESFLKRLTGIHSHGDNYEESNEGVALENSDVKAIESYHSTTGYPVRESYDDDEELSILTISQLFRHKQKTGESIVVSDLSRDDRKLTSSKYRQYAWTLLTVALFYGLPAVQLVIAYQLTLNHTGNENICYYNFLCAHPYGILSDFNHVWSNVGYALLGILFFLIVFRRSRIYYRKVNKFEHVGIPQYFGLYYAMAFGLFVEGFMSGTYHICPNKANFQFDTSFMYIIAGMCMLRLYQSRHPDIETSAYRAFFAFGVVILIALFGVLYNSVAFWGFFFTVYMIAIIFINVEIYYMGKWVFVFEFFTGFCGKLRGNPVQAVRKDCLTCSRPHYQSRWFLLLFATAINVGIAIYGIASLYPDFATYFLIIMIANLGIYFAYYFFMKLFIARERPSKLTFLTVVLMLTCWVPALYFFGQGLTNWATTPAKSRNGNRSCILFGFYDDHDVWHFLSAFAMFFSFMTILTVDDDIMDQDRNGILVF
ncbi:SID1 transmembrane family member 1-like [Corticium candelabrum]|uniref:SID1 transmembrane family member 1-like n=1 Tax=Corticium candelabrum TaxID=121492 RepID=UPI002E262FDC|nr:SID1 transmembrane family member 1-like [Corticium candelabrum]